MYRVAVVASHPIHRQATWLRALARVVNLEVLFCHQPDDATPSVLDGYAHTWLQNVSPTPDVSRFIGCDTPDIVRHLTHGRFDACVVSGWYLKSYVQAIRACTQRAIPLVAYGDSHLKTPRSAARTAVRYLPYRWFLNRINAHLYVGTAHRMYLRSYGVPDSKLFFVPHCVDNDYFTREADRARQSGERLRLRSSIGATSSAIAMLFVGDLVVGARGADFVRALAGQRASEMIGVVVGDGEQRHELEALAQEVKAPVRFLGRMDRCGLPRWYAACDAIVLPSDRNTWGLVVHEAMACGLPAIVSDRVGCADDLITPHTGLVFPAGDIDRLRRAMGSVAEAVIVRRTAIEQAVTATVRRYSVDVACAGLLQALTTLCDSEVAVSCAVRQLV